MFYTIGEMAKKLSIAPSTLRYYDKEGLLPFVERSEGGIRMFQEKDMDCLEIIECMKKTGMPIKEIKLFMDWCIEGDSTIDKRLQLIQRQQAAVEEQIAQMQQNLHMLKYKTWYYQTAKQAGTCQIHETMPQSQIPEEFRKYTE